MKTKSESYGVRSRDYLKRARERLDELTPEGLFYAALELRGGVESRLQLYVSAQAETDDLRKLGWKIPPLAKTLNKQFKLGTETIRVQVLRQPDNTIVGDWYYTPVTPKLQKMSGQLGNYLHAVQPTRSLNNPWWQEARKFMEEVYAELEKATRGDLVSVPLMDPGTSQVHFTISPKDGYEEDPSAVNISAGQRCKLSISYVEQAPKRDLE